MLAYKDVYYETISDNIRGEMAKKKLTIEKLAEISKVGKGTIVTARKNAQSLKLENLVMIAEGLDTRLEFLLYK